MTDHVDGWPWFSNRSSSFEPPQEEKSKSSSQGFSPYQLKRLCADHHVGEGVPRRLLGYWLEGKRMRLTSDVKARYRTKHIQQHLRLVSGRVKGRYKSMTPLKLDGAPGEPDQHLAVDLELGLVYRVVRETSGVVHSVLLYSFFTPLAFLELPDSNDVDGPNSCLEDPDDADDADEPDGGNSTICQHPGHAHFVTCLGAPYDKGTGDYLKMVADQYGEVTCAWVEQYYRPAQFKLLYDGANNETLDTIVGVLAMGMGPEDNFFLALVNDKTRGERFVIKVADEDMKNRLVPKDPKFHFRLTTDQEKGLYRFQAVAGDSRYLAFGAHGKQERVTPTDMKRDPNNTYHKTLFHFTYIS